MVLPHINPYTGEVITDVAGKATSWTCANAYQKNWVESRGFTCEDTKQWWWVESTSDWQGVFRDNVGNFPLGQKLDGHEGDAPEDALASSANVIPFAGMDPKVKTKISFYPGNQISTISSSAFMLSKGVTVVLPGYVPGAVDPEDIRSVDFSNAKALTDIGTYAFNRFVSSSQPLKLSGLDSLQAIRGFAFFAPGASNIVINDNPRLTTIEDYAFNRSSASAIEISNNPSLTSIGEDVFDAVSNAEAVAIKGSPQLTSIGASTFSNIRKAKKFVCENCDALTTIPGDLFSGNRRAPGAWEELDFRSAPNLNLSVLGSGFVSYAKGHPSYNNKVVIWADDEVAARTASRYNYLINPCPADQVPAADQPADWQASDFAYTINDQGDAVIQGFSGCGAMKAAKHTDVVLPEKDPSGNLVAGIANNAFAGYSITGLDASAAKALRVIEGPLTDKRDLKTLNLSGTQIETFPASLVSGNKNLSSIDLSHTPLKEIPDNALYGLYSLTKFDLTGSDQVTRIGNRAFYQIGRPLEGFDLANLPALTEIGDEAFCEASMFTELDLSKNPKLKTIGVGAFQLVGRTSGFRNPLTSVTFDNPELESIGERAFINNKLTSLTIKAPKLNTIGNRAFMWNQISELDLGPSGLKTIGEEAFAYNKIAEARIPNSLAELTLTDNGQSPFHDNPGMNDDAQVILRTADKANPDGIDPDYVSGVKTGTQVNDGWLINPILVTVEARVEDGNTLLRSTQIYVAEDKVYMNPGIGVYLPNEPNVTLKKQADNYTVVVPYKQPSGVSNDDFNLRQDNYSGISRYKIGEEMLTWLYFDATGINMDESGLALEVYYDPQFLDKHAINVPPSDFLKRGQDVADNGVLRIPMVDHILGGTSIGIPISWKFKTLETPQEYTTDINAVLRDSKGNVIQTAKPVSLTGFYELPALKKTTNGADINGTIQVSPRLAMSYDVTRGGDAVYNFNVKGVERYMGEYTLTDTLPTYTRAKLDKFEQPLYENKVLQTEQSTAVFDAEKNPGWVLSADGKSVSYTVSEVRTTNVNIPALKLSYPYAVTKTIFVNKAKLDLTPYNKPSYEPVITLESQTSNQYNHEVREIPWMGSEDYEMRAISPHWNMEYGGAYMYDVKKDREKGIDWRLVASAGRKVIPSTGEVVEDTSLSKPVFKYYGYDQRLKMDYIQAPWAGTVQAIDDAHQPVGNPISFNAGDRVQLPDSWQRGPGIQIAADPSLSFSGMTGVTVHTSLVNPNADHFDPTQGSTKNAFNADSSVVFERTDHLRGDQVANVERTDPSSATLRQLVQRVGITKTTTYPQNTSLRMDSTGSYSLAINHSIEMPDLAEEVKDATVVDVLPPYMTVDSVELDRDFAAAGGTYRSYFLPANHVNGNQQVLVFKAPGITQPRDSSTTPVATIKTRTNVQMDGQVLNTAYLGWSNQDKVHPMFPSRMQNIADAKGTEVKSAELQGIGIHSAVAGAKFQPDRVSFNMTKVKELSARKFIRKSVNDSWTTDGVVTKLGSEFQYRLSLTNRMPSDVQDPVRTGMEYYDVLPTPGDVGITTGEKRESKFSNTLLRVNAPTGYDVYYTTDTIDMSKFNNQRGPDVYLPNLEWTELTGDVPAGTVATAVHIKAQDGVKFSYGEVLNFDLTMKAPSDDRLVGQRAWNSYVRGDDSSARLIEPNRVWNELGRPDSVIKLKKVEKGPSHSPLSGAVFGLYQSNGNWVATATSNDQGIVRFENVNSNLDYEIRELVAPKTATGQSYSLLKEPIKVTSKQLIQSGYNLSLGNVENELPGVPVKPNRGTISLNKVNQNREPIQGIQFKLTGEFSFKSLIENGFKPQDIWHLNEQMQIEMIASSDSTGRVLFENLPMGKYKIEEINNPSSVYHGNWSRTVTLTNKGAPEKSPAVVIDGQDSVVNDTVQIRVTKLGILDPAKADIEWNKLKATDGAKLKGADFEVVDAQGNVAASGTTDADGYWLAQGLKPDVVYELRETATPEGYNAYDGAPIKFKVTSDGKYLDGDGNELQYRRIYVPNDRKQFTSSVTVHKVDASNKTVSLAGATFLLERRDGNGSFVPYGNTMIPADGKIVTDDDGVAVFGELTQGVYRLSEASAPAGYLPSFEPKTFTVSNDQTQSFEYTAENRPTGVKITKVEQALIGVSEAEADAFIDKNPGFEKVAVGSSFNVVKNLPGAKFAIYKTKEVNGQRIADVEAGAVEVIETGTNGLATSTKELDVNATYAVVEAQAPSGYHAVTNPYFFNLADLGRDPNFDGIIRITVPNKASEGQITVAKHDGNTGKVLPGVSFDLYKRAEGSRERGEKVATAVTGQNGMAIFSGLELGYAYTLVETAAPAGFGLVGDIDVGVLTEQSAHKQFVVWNYDNEVTFKKVDQDQQPLAGAEFGLYDSEDSSASPLQKATSDDTGKVKFKKLVAGTYYLRELTTPDGYVKNDVVYKFEVAADGSAKLTHPDDGVVNAVVNQEITPEPVTVQLTASKTLEGAELQADQFTFELLDKDGAVVQTAKNAADGSVKFDPLQFTKAGKYEYTIVERAEGDENIVYDSTRHKVTVTVTKNAQHKLEASVDYASGAAPVFKNAEVPPPSTPPKPGVPKTGGAGWQLATLAGLIVAGGAAIALRRRRR